MIRLASRVLAYRRGEPFGNGQARFCVGDAVFGLETIFREGYEQLLTYLVLVYTKCLYYVGHRIFHPRVPPLIWCEIGLSQVLCLPACLPGLIDKTSNMRRCILHSNTNFTGCPTWSLCSGYLFPERFGSSGAPGKHQYDGWRMDARMYKVSTATSIVHRPSSIVYHRHHLLRCCWLPFLRGPAAAGSLPFGAAHRLFLRICRESIGFFLFLLLPISLSRVYGVDTT